jgi:hypothetical protein
MLKQITQRLRNAWLVITNHDANTLVSLACDISVACAYGKPAQGEVKVTRTNGKVQVYEFSVRERVEQPCEAVQMSDAMVCDKCGLGWDKNDPEPPKCGGHHGS